MVRFDNTQNDQFASWIGHYKLQHKNEDYHGDGQKRSPGGKAILSSRALKLNREAKKQFAPDAEHRNTRTASQKDQNDPNPKLSRNVNRLGSKPYPN
jgi:hypothetical protein